MGACYKCGGDGWLSKVTVWRRGALPHVSVRNGNTRSLARQFAGRSKLCSVCEGRGVLADQPAGIPRFIPHNAG